MKGGGELKTHWSRVTKMGKSLKSGTLSGKQKHLGGDQRRLSTGNKNNMQTEVE